MAAHQRNRTIRRVLAFAIGRCAAHLHRMILDVQFPVHEPQTDAEQF